MAQCSGPVEFRSILIETGIRDTYAVLLARNLSARGVSETDRTG